MEERAVLRGDEWSFGVATAEEMDRALSRGLSTFSAD